MKKIIAMLLSLSLMLFLLYGCEFAEEKQQNTIEKVTQLQNLNDSIDKELRDIINIYSNVITYDELLSSDETLKKVEDDISTLKQGLEDFNTDEEVMLEYDLAMFDKYDSLISKLWKWREEQMEYSLDNHKQGNYEYEYQPADGIESAYKLSYASQLQYERSDISSYRPDYYSVIDSLREQ